MAAAHIIPPPSCSLRSTWSTHHRSYRDCPAVVLGGEVRWVDDAVRLAWNLRPRPHVRWRRARTCNARVEYRGTSAEEDASTLMEMTTLVDDLFQLNEAVNEANRGIGADVRTRVDVLYNRATLLKYSADNMVAAGGRVPVQLTATLKGLQREHASMENIVRLVMEAGPVITDVDDPPTTKVSFFSKGAEVETRNTADSGDIMFKEKESESKPSLFESLTLESSLKAAALSEEYALSTLAADDSSPLAAFRREIERRVMEQLAAEKKPVTERGVITSSEGLPGKGYATSESTGVVEPTQNLPLRGRLPRLRRAVKDASVVVPAASQPQLLQDQSSLTDAAQQQQAKTVDLEQLRSELSALEQQLANAQEGSARADRAEAQLQQLTEEMAATVPLDIHEQVVKLERQSLVMARKKLAQVTAELREKEVILGAVKQEMVAEQDRLLGKVRMLSSELSKRVSVEEVEAAVTNAVHELETELRKALQRAESMKLELQTNDKLLKQLQNEWEAERASLRSELAHFKEQLAELQQEQAGDRAKVIEAADKVNELEESVTRLQRSMVEAEEERISREKFVLATVRSLVADMVKTKRVQGKSHTPGLVEATTAVDANYEASRMRTAEAELESMLSEEKSVALETFFHIMGALIQQDSVKLETLNHRLRHSKVDVTTKPDTITLYYESSWEFAYVHYSADSSGWTELPGVCMRDEVVVNNMLLKVIDIEGSSIEFVLTDGRGSWDCAPIGGNYHIKNSGTFLLSSGCIEQKQ